jgi:hypothetical protein
MEGGHAMVSQLLFGRVSSLPHLLPAFHTRNDGMTDASTDRRVWSGKQDTRPRWRRLIGYATAIWSLAYGLLGLYWARGGDGFPFGRDRDPDADAVESILAGARAESTGPVIAGLGLAGVPIALTMARSREADPVRRSLVGAAGGTAALLLVVVPDQRLIVGVAFVPVLLLRERFGWRLEGSARHPTGATRVLRQGRVPWPVVNQLLLVAGGLLWAGTAIAYADRDGDLPPWMAPDAAAKWGRGAVGVAVAIPLLYAASRWAWALGFPLGLNEEFFREGQESGLWRVGSALSTVTAAGAMLTLGLTQRWGEVIPNWLPGLAGKGIPPALAVAPASLISVAVTSAGLGYVRGFVRSGIPPEGWGMVVPGLLWPLWGAALGAATFAYSLRRQSR